MSKRIELYRLIDEGEEYTTGTKAEVIKEHNDWLSDSELFDTDEIAEYTATTIDELNEHWTVEQFYTVVV